MQSLFKPSSWLCVLLGAAYVFGSQRARAALPEASQAPEDQPSLRAATPRGAAGQIHIDRARGTSVSLGPYGGLALHDTARGGVAHLFVGAVGRVRINYVELGGNLEISDRVQESWRLLGGFVGGYIPFENWVDLELAVGAGLRHYLNPDQRYGSGGFDVKVPVITLRAGFSDRLGQGVFGVRLGGELLFGFDLKRENATWTYSYTDLTDAAQVSPGEALSLQLARGAIETVVKRIQ